MTFAVDPQDKALNYVVVNGMRSPGKAVVSGADVVYNYDVPKSYGISGAKLIYHGRAPSEFTVTFHLWERLHFAEWPFFVEMLKPPKPGVQLVVEMKHPIISQADVNAVAVRKLGQLEKQSNGIWTSIVQCVEYREPKPDLVKVRGAIPGVAAGKIVAPKTEADIALEQETARFSAARAAAR